MLALAATLGRAACGGPAGPGDPATTTTYLLIDNWAARAVSIPSSDGASADLAFQENVSLGDDVTPCSMAIGPDGLDEPCGIAFDGAGDVFIGMNGAPTALRYAFDDPPSTGRRFDLPSATLTLPIPQGDGVFGPIGVTIDEGGALWTASNNGRLLHRVSDPAALDRTVTPDVTTTWSDAGFTRGGSLVWTSRTTP